MLDELKYLLMNKPFKPFRLQLRDGSRLDVTRQFQLGIGLTKLMYAEEPSGRVLTFPIEEMSALETIDSISAA